MGVRTLIVVRRAPAELKTYLVGLVLDFCSARFRALMDAVNEERAPSVAGCGEFVAIIETRGGCEGMWHKGCEP